MNKSSSLLHYFSPKHVSDKLTSRAAFSAACEEYGLVYFGDVHVDSDEQRIVRGVTTSAKHHDKHYCLGTVKGYDVVFVERSDEVSYPNASKTEKYRWIILQIDLRQVSDLSHVFIDGGHHEQAFYANLFAKFARLTKVETGLLADTDPLFTERFTVYTPSDMVENFPPLLSLEMSSILAHHFGHFDFEWYDDQLLVYSTGRPATKHLLDHMMKAGIWLAEELEKRTKK